MKKKVVRFKTAKQVRNSKKKNLVKIKVHAKPARCIWMQSSFMGCGSCWKYYEVGDWGPCAGSVEETIEVTPEDAARIQKQIDSVIALEKKKEGKIYVDIHNKRGGVK